MSLKLPQPFGPYLLVHRFAAGGMGEVFLAKRRLGVGFRLCVVKMVPTGTVLTSALTGRLLDEARTATSLTHRNLANIIDVGEFEGTTYIAAEFISGRDLHAIVKCATQAGRLPSEGVSLHIIGEVLEALAYVHRAKDPVTSEPLQIVHRDITPHNILVSFEGEVKLIDFGIASSSVKQEQTKTGVALGKLRYMAPEQARADVIDGAADVYAAAIIAVELLSGRRFYGTLSDASVARSLSAEGSSREACKEVDADLRRVLEPALAFNPSERPTASALRQQLHALQVERRTLVTSEAVREFLGLLFEGDMHQEERTRARLMQDKPTARTGTFPSTFPPDAEEKTQEWEQSTLAMLAPGYAIARRASDGGLICGPEDAPPGTAIALHTGSGLVRVTVDA